MILKSCVSRTTGIMLTVLLGSLIFLASCFKKEKFDKFEIDPLNVGWGLPIIDSKLSLGDILGAIQDKKNLKANPLDSSYTFTYFDTLPPIKSENLLVLQSRQFSKDLTLPATAPTIIPAGGNYSGTINGIEPLIFSTDATIKSILFKQGILNVSFASTFKHSITATVTIPSLKNNNGVYKHDFNIPFNGGNITPAPSDRIDLNGYTLDLKGSGGSVNTILYTVDYKITGSGQLVLPGDKLTLGVDFNNLKFKNIIGNFSGLTVPSYSGSTDIKIFDNTLQGNVFFDRATVVLDISNSFGIAMDIKVDSMQTETAYGEKTIPITANTPNGIEVINGKGNIKFASPSLGEIGFIKKTEIVLDTNTSNIKAMINPAPNKLKYVLTPRFQPSNTDQFITDQSKLEVAIKVIIPIYGILEYYLLGDTLGIDKFPARSGEEWSLDSVQFTFKTTNSLPVDAMTQLYFVDSLGKKIDSLLTRPEAFIRRPLINSKGKSIEEAVQVTKVHMGGMRYDKIMARTKNIYMIARVLTSKSNDGRQRNIQLFSYNYLRIEICALAIGQVKPKVN